MPNSSISNRIVERQQTVDKCLLTEYNLERQTKAAALSDQEASNGDR